MTKILIGNVRGPQGPKGDKGDAGSAGPAGPNTVPTNQAIADAVNAHGSPARAALESAIVEVLEQHGGGGGGSLGRGCWLLIGQSNTVGWMGPIDLVYLDRPDPRVTQWPASGPYVGLGRPVDAVDPLYHVAPLPGTVGMGLTFGKEASALSNEQVLLVPAAYGGTGFSTTPETWDRTVSGSGIVNLAQIALVQMNAAIASHPDNYAAGIIWIQGEADTGMGGAAYQAKLDDMIDWLRANITGATATLPFIIGQMVPERIDVTPASAAINAVHLDTPRRKLGAAFFYGARGYNDGLTVPLHYNAEGNRRNGIAGGLAIPRAKANILGTEPVAVNAITLAQSGTTVNVSWRQPSCRVTNFAVRYSTDGGATRTTSTRATPNLDARQTITGVASGATILVQVQTTNEQGSVWSESASLTLPYVPGQPGFVLGTPLSTAVPYTITPPTVDSTHGAPAGYLIEYRQSGSSTWTTFGTVTALTGLINGLPSSTQYDIRAFAVNSTGPGPSSPVRSATTSSPTFIIDDVGVSAFRAVGLRKLRAAYSGSAIRVRYTDGTFADIGFSSGVLDTATLLAGTAAHGGGATIHTWYDQSGNGRDLVQTTLAQQARIVASNVVDTANGKPSATTTGSAQYFDSSGVGLYAAGAASALAVYSDTVSSGSHSFAVENGSAVGLYNVLLHIAGGSGRSGANSTGGTLWNSTSNAGAMPNGQLAQTSMVDTGSEGTTYVNGAAGGTVAYSRSGQTLTPTSFVLLASTLPGGNPGSSNVVGSISEAIFFAAALNSGARAVGEVNQKAYYSTP